MSAATEIFGGGKHDTVQPIRTNYHMKALVCVMSGLVSGGAVYTSALVMLLGGTLDCGNSFVQLIVHFPVYDGMSDVVAQVKRTNEETIDGRLRNGIDLSREEISMVSW